jgi:hypothetical protein
MLQSRIQKLSQGSVAKQPAAGSTATVWEQCHELAEGFSPGVGWKVKKDMSDEKVCTTPFATNGTPYLSLLSKRGEVV